jgi:sec-independent protein translocase protein TatB
MFNIGFAELAVIAVIALIFIGPKQLPEMAKVVGRLMGEFKRASSDLLGNISDVKNDAHNFVSETSKQIEDAVLNPTESEVHDKPPVDLPEGNKSEQIHSKSTLTDEPTKKENT